MLQCLPNMILPVIESPKTSPTDARQVQTASVLKVNVEDFHGSTWVDLCANAPRDICLGHMHIHLQQHVWHLVQQSAACSKQDISDIV